VRKLIATITVVGLALLVLSVLASAQEEKKEAVRQYVGAAKCKVCHNSEAKGAQYAKWEASKHSKAYEVLASEEAIAAGKKLGVDNPQTSDQCLVCHVTGFAAPAEAKAESFDQTEGVGCEACHGPGSDYKSMKIMKDLDAAMAAGLTMPNEETCKGCHNEKSPTFKEFDFAAASKIIAHPYPEKEE
jgi:3-hydroxyisobutyrate dehydrogenase-like beta-hydroxyacid dehydrogenase